MKVKCCIEGCTKNIQPQHRFPNPKKDLVRFKKWIEMSNSEILASMDPASVYNLKKICHCHFETQDFSVGSKRVHANAIPTLNLPKRAVTKNNELATENTEKQYIVLSNVINEFSATANVSIDELKQDEDSQSSTNNEQEDVQVNRAKLQWKNVRDAFVRHKRKRQSSAGPGKPYVYEAELQFLLPHILTKDREEPPVQESLTSSIEVKTEDFTNISEESQLGLDQETLYDEEIPEDQNTIPSNTHVEFNGTDPVDAFFHGMAQTVKRLQPKTIARVKKAVANLVMDAEIEELENIDRQFS